MSDRLCVVMPVYNECDAIGVVLRKWSAALDALKIEYTIRPYNDGSKDDSLSVMREIAKRLPNVDVRDKPNGGHGPTILQGYREAATDGFGWVFQIDSDDEMGPEKFAELWSKRENFDFLVGIRDGRRQALPRKIISCVSRLCVRLFYGKSVWDVNTPYRLMRVSAFADFFKDIPAKTFAPNVMLSGLAAKYQLRCFEMPVPQHDRQTGEVSIRKWKLLKAAARSFWNTVSYACEWSFLRSPARALVFLTLLAGMFLSVWFFLSPLRFAFALLYGALALILFRKGVPNRLRHLVRWCCENPMKALAIVLAVGVMERVVFLAVFSDLLNFDYINGDFVWLYERAVDLSKGKWSVNKSWTTVALWSGIVKLFGQSTLMANVAAGVVQLGATVFGYLFVKRWFGTVGALVFAFLFFCSINVLQHMPNVTATEHTFSLFGMMSLWCSCKVVDARSKSSTFAYSILLSVLMWVTLWCRGEGICLWVALPFWIVYYKVCVRHEPKQAVMVTAVSLVLFIGGAMAAVKINAMTSDARTIFCSEDNLWPRLHGATLSSNGTCLNTNSTMILNQYQADHPNVKWDYFPKDTPRWGKYRAPRCMFYNCPHEMVPYVKNEISRRWRAMSLSQIICFVCQKERGDWCGDYLYTLQMTLDNGKSRIPYYMAQATAFVFPGLIAMLGFAFCLWSLLLLLTGRLPDQWLFPAVTVISILALNFAALALTESSLRYGYAFNLLWPIFGSGFVSMLLDESSAAKVRLMPAAMS